MRCRQGSRSIVGMLGFVPLLGALSCLSSMVGETDRREPLPWSGHPTGAHPQPNLQIYYYDMTNG